MFKLRPLKEFRRNNVLPVFNAPEPPDTHKIRLIKRLTNEIQFWEDLGKPEYAKYFQDILKNVDNF